MSLQYTLKHYNDLSLDDLYMILKLRQEVFILEQNCPYVDCDDKDQHCFHLMGVDLENDLGAYSRIVPIKISYDDYASIGRVITSSKYRNTGEGRILMNTSIGLTKKLYPDLDIKISAQSYISHFYASLGFVKVGEEYLEDGIPHIAMILK